MYGNRVICAPAAPIESRIIFIIIIYYILLINAVTISIFRNLIICIMSTDRGIATEERVESPNN